jgi:hypothetical protein
MFVSVGLCHWLSGPKPDAIGKSGKPSKNISDAAATGRASE